MNEQIDLGEEALTFYQTLTETVWRGKQPLAWAKRQVRDKGQRRYALPETLTYLAEQGRQIAWRSPHQGYILATLVHTASQIGTNELVRAQCALALAEASNRFGLWVEATDLCAAAQKTFAQQGDLLATARSKLGLATAYHHLNRNPEALALCLEAQEVLKQRGYGEGMGQCALLLASIYRTQGQYHEACQSAQQARRTFAALDLIAEATRCDMELAYIYVCEQRFDEAQSLLDDATGVCSQAGLVVETAQGSLVQAWIYLERGEYHSALQVLQTARDVYYAEKMQAALRHCELNIANVYRRLGRSDEALPIYFRLRQEFAEQSMAINAANCEMNIGLAYKQQNRYVEALTFFQQAGQTCLNAGLTVHAARCQTNMAQVEEILGAYDQAFERHQRARDIFVQAGMAINAAHCEENMARICLTIQRYNRALELLQSAGQTFQAEGASLLAVDNQVHLARVYQAIGQSDLARQMLKQAQAAYAEQQMPGQEALCLLQLADLERTQEEPLRAATLYRRARQEFLARQWLVNVALCELGLGEASLAHGQDEEARQWFASALPVLDPDFPDWIWRAQYGLARCYHRQERTMEALDHYLKAIDAIRRGRAGLYTTKGSSTFFASRQHVYNEALALTLQLGAEGWAVEIVEQSKAQTYLALLFNSLDGLRPKRANGVLGNLLSREQALQRRIESLQNTLYFPVGATKDQSSSSYNDQLEQLTQAKREHEEVVDRLFRARPLWTSTVHPPPFVLGAFREAMATRWPGSWGSLAYYISGSQLTILYLDAETVIARTKSLTLFEEKLLRICTSSHETRRADVYQREVGHDTGASPDGGSAFLRHLYPLLIPEEVQERLSPERLLIIVPHGILHALPFHTLQSPEGSYLVQQVIAVYAPSLNIFQLLLARNEDQGKSESKKMALVVGISEFGQRAPRLATAPVEARAVHRLLGRDSTLCLNEEAKRTTLLAMNEAGILREYRIIHFATHTLFEKDASLQSRLLLHEGHLTVPDLFDLSLAADLVTLSSCEGARADINVGDEMMGLAQALFHAGARTLVAGLWRVPDETTGMLMTRFYRALHAGQMPAQALRTAQLQMIAAGYTPFQWAPFILLGHPGYALT